MGGTTPQISQQRTAHPQARRWGSNPHTQQSREVQDQKMAEGPWPAPHPLGGAHPAKQAPRSSQIHQRCGLGRPPQPPHARPTTEHTTDRPKGDTSPTATCTTARTTAGTEGDGRSRATSHPGGANPRRQSQELPPILATTRRLRPFTTAANSQHNHATTPTTRTRPRDSQTHHSNSSHQREERQDHNNQRWGELTAPHHPYHTQQPPPPRIQHCDPANG